MTSDNARPKRESRGINRTERIKVKRGSQAVQFTIQRLQLEIEDIDKKIVELRKSIPQITEDEVRILAKRQLRGLYGQRERTQHSLATAIKKSKP